MEEKLVDSPDGTKHEYFALSSIVEVLGSRPVISTNGDSSGADYFADLGILNCTCLMHLLYGSAYLRWQFEYGCREFIRTCHRRILSQGTYQDVLSMSTFTHAFVTHQTRSQAGEYLCQLAPNCHVFVPPPPHFHSTP